MTRCFISLLFLLPACGGADDASARDGNSFSDGASARDLAAADGALRGDAASSSPDATSGFDAALPGDAGDAGSDDQPFAAMRASCAFSAGALPKDTFGPSIVAQKIPIDTFVIVMHENRSFDHYFQNLPAYGQPAAEVGDPVASFTGATGTKVSRAHLSSLCIADTGHSWNAQHAAWDAGKNDGFAKVNGNAGVGDPTGQRALGYYTEADIPFYYAFANAFAIDDRYFCPTLTSTGPNRLYLYAATSNGSITNNGSAGITVPNTIFGRMQAAGVTWKVYSVSSYSFEGSIFSSLPTMYPSSFGSMTEYAADAAAGKLPNVVFLYTGSDEHPPADPQRAQKEVADAFAVLAASPQWQRSAFLFTYDENGGIYDHVPPPKACKPDSVPPALAQGDVPGDFAQYGFRVPIIVASAWSKPHFVSHVVNDHTSILRLLELRFGLQALTHRDANANGLLDLFDFTKMSFPKAPALPAATIDPNRAC